jgi:hypothetical protein
LRVEAKLERTTTCCFFPTLTAAALVSPQLGRNINKTALTMANSVSPQFLDAQLQLYPAHYVGQLA